MGHDVFVSHSSHDKRFADAIVARLEQNGIRCWVAPRDILPGANWAGSILQAIAGCKLMVLVFSDNTNSSQHILREVERAVHHRIPVAPVRIQDLKPTDDLEYFLSSSHWMDAMTEPFEQHLDRLSAQLKLLLNMPLTVSKGPVSAAASPDFKRPDPAKAHDSAAAAQRPLPAKRSYKGLVRFALAAAVFAGAAWGVIYYRVARGRTPADLLAALKSGDNDAVVAIVDKQPDLVIRADADGMTPLHYAAQQNLPAAALELIKKGGKLEARDLKGRTPLHYAALCNREEMAVLLLGHGAREEAQDNAFKTPYQLAQENNQTDARLVFERSDLIRAIGKHDLPAIDKLITPELAKSASEEGWTALHYAAREGDDYTSKQLLDKGARVDAQTTREYESEARYEPGRTPLLLACEYSKEVGGHYATVVQQLIEHGASADLADADGMTALHYAARNNDNNIATLLIAKAKPDAKTREGGSTPLHIAAQTGSFAVLNLLLANGSDPTLVDAKGQTALSVAAAAGQADIIKILLPLRCTNDVRLSARKLAEVNKHAEAVALFDQWWKAELFSTIEQINRGPDQIKAVSDLLAWPVPHAAATTRPSDGLTPLNVALTTAQPSIDLLKLLLNAEPGMVDQPDPTGESPLYLAVRTTKPDAVISLLAASADRKAMNAADSRSQRLLNVAVASGNSATVNLLIDKYQLNVNQPDAAGITPLQMAAERLDSAMVRTLLANGAKPDAHTLATAAKASPAPGSAPSASGNGGSSETVNAIGSALLMDQLQDPATTDQTLSQTLSEFDQVNFHPLDKSLPNGQLPLQVALVSGSADTKSVLFDKVNQQHLLNQQNAAGETVLHTAAMLGQVDVVQGLLDAGADYSIKNNAGLTAEDAAKASGKQPIAATLAAWRTQKEKVAADAVAASAKADAVAAAKQDKDQADRQARLDQASADAAAKKVADATAAHAWFQDIYDRHQVLAIAGVAKLNFIGTLLGGIRVEEQGSGLAVSCTCDDSGVLTVVIDNGQLSALWPGDVQTKLIPSGRMVIVGYETRTVHHGKHKPDTVEQVPLTRPDGSTVKVAVHTYMGQLVPKGPGVFEWQVPNHPVNVSTEAR